MYTEWNISLYILLPGVCIFYFIFSDNPLPMSREPSVQFKEIEVKQLDKSALYNMPIQGYWFRNKVYSSKSVCKY